MSDKLKEYVRESLAKWPVKERLKGVSAEEIVQALSPETRQELARLLKANGASAEPGAAKDGGHEPGS